MPPLNRNDIIIMFLGIFILVISGEVIMAYRTPYWEATLIFLVPATIFIAIVTFLLKFIYTDERREERQIEKELKKQQRIIRQKEDKKQKILTERKAYKKGRSSRTAKAAKLLDTMESSKRRM